MRKLRWFLVLPLIIYACYQTRKDEGQYARNKRPQEDLRQARGAILMWSSGVFADRRPIQTLSDAERFLNQVQGSEADSTIKQEAHEAQQWLTAHPHYCRFTQQFAVMGKRFPLWREIVDQASWPNEQWAPEKAQEAKPKFLVVVAQRHPSKRLDPQENPLFFDPEMIEALGETGASTPDEVRTIVALYFASVEAGEYKLGFKVKDQFVEAPVNKEFPDAKLNAYLHTCQLLVIDAETRAVLHAHRFFQQDPAEMPVRLLSSQPGAKDGYGLLRDDVEKYLQEFISRQVTK